MLMAPWAGASALGSGCGSPAARKATEASTPRRIVSLTLATDEILLDLVPVERIAGVTNLVDDPEIPHAAGSYP